MSVQQLKAMGTLLVLAFAWCGLANAEVSHQRVPSARGAGSDVLVRSKYSSTQVLRKGKVQAPRPTGVAPQAINPPDPNNPDLIRYQIRCKDESQWPDSCSTIEPFVPYPAASSADYAIGMYTDFDGVTAQYEIAYTDSAGNRKFLVATLKPSECGPEGYFITEPTKWTLCAYGGVTLAFLYPHLKGRLVATVKASGVTVFYQLMDIKPHIITKVSGDGQIGLVGQAFRAPLKMEMRDFEGAVPKYPVRSNAVSMGAITYNIAGPDRARGMSVTGSENTRDGKITANAVFGSKPGSYQVTAAHSDSSPLEEPFIATAVTRLDPDDNADDSEGNGEEECTVADPVSIGIGNSFQQEVDIKRNDYSLMEFVRSYNSMGSRSGLMKNYWTTLFDIAVLPALNGSQSARVRRPDGRYIPFVLFNGAYVSLRPYFHGKLEAISGGWRFTTKEQIVETYDSAGKWLTIADARGRTLTATYAKGLLTKVTSNASETLKFTYNKFDQVATMTDQAGRVWSYSYDGFSNLTQLMEPDGVLRAYFYESPYSPYALTGIGIGKTIEQARENRHVSWVYDQQNRVIENGLRGSDPFSGAFDNRRYTIQYNDLTGERLVTDPKGNVSAYVTRTINGRGFVDSVVGPGFAMCGSADSVVERDSRENVLSLAQFGVTTRFGDYDSKGQYAFKIEAAGTPAARQYDYTYDPRFYGKPSTISAPSVAPGQRKVTSLSYNSAGDLTQQTIQGYRPDGSPVSRIASFQYGGPLGQISLIDGPRDDIADVRSFEYSATSKRLLRVTDADGTVLRDNILYTATGEVASEDLANGLRATYSYYAGSDLLKTLTETATNGQRRITDWTYDERRRVTSVVVSNGSTIHQSTEFGYTPAGDLAYVRSPGAGQISYSYDGDGNPTEERYHNYGYGESTKWIQRTFDAFGRITSLINPYNTQATVFHPNGTLTSARDGRGNVTTYQYDVFKNMTRALQPGVPAALFEHDVNDNATRIVDPNGGQTVQVFDDLGNRLTRQSPDTGTMTATYDSAGNMVGNVDAMSQATSYRYDGKGRLTSSDRVGAADDEAFAYGGCANGAGKLCSATNGIGDFLNYEYDSFGNVTRLASNAGVVSFAYDSAGNLIEQTYPSLRKVRYAYNNAGQVTGISVVDGANVYPLARSMVRLPYGPASSWVYGNGLVETRQFDLAYRPVSFNTGDKSVVAYTSYDASNNVTGRNVNGIARGFGYDALNRLTTVTGPGFDQAYAYDAVGNRTVLTENGQTTTYHYTAQSNRLLSESLWTYARDANGNETRKTASDGNGLDFTYSADNRLIGITDAQTASQLVAGYRYNALGQRTLKVSANNDRRYIHGLKGELLAELLTNGSVAQEYVYLDGAPVALLGPPSSSEAPFAVDQIVDNPMSADGCTKKNAKSAAGGFYLECSTSQMTNTQVDWNWSPPVSGEYDVSVLWAWSSSTQCYTWNTTFGPNTCVGTTDTPAGTWLSLGRRQLAAGASSQPFLSAYTNRPMGLATMRMDAIRYVLVQRDENLRDYVYVHTDALGAPVRMSDKASNVVWNADYDVYGLALVDEDVDGNGASATMNLRFPGQYYDAETATHYNYYRQYDPGKGRYLESDPIGLAGGLNTYAYVMGNPVMWTDPLGLEVFVCSQPAFGIANNPIDHQWIRTDTVEAGMGGTRGNVPGNESGDRPGDPVQVTDHTGRSQEKGSSCERVPNVNEKKVNAQLKIGTPLGRWGPTNQCQSFVRSVLDNARNPTPGASGTWQSGASGGW